MITCRKAISQLIYRQKKLTHQSTFARNDYATKGVYLIQANSLRQYKLNSNLFNANLYDW